MEWLDQHIREVDNFPRPNWEAIYADVESKHKESDQHDLWCGIASVPRQHKLDRLA